MPKTDLLIWDWNGTLLDDVDLCLETLNLLLRRHGYAQQYDLTAYKRMFRFPIQDYYRDAGFDFDCHPYEDLAVEFMDHYIPHSTAGPLTPDARAVLDAVHDLGLPQVILSASPVDVLHDQTAQRGVSGCFEAMLGLSDIYAASKVELGKQFLAQAGFDPQAAVLVGDSVHDFEVAQAMGTRCILCCAGHQCRQALEVTGAVVIDRLSQLPSLL